MYFNSVEDAIFVNAVFDILTIGSCYNAYHTCGDAYASDNVCLYKLIGCSLLFAIALVSIELSFMDHPLSFEE